MEDLGLIPGLERSPGEGRGYPFQYSGLENSMDCIVHGIAKSWAQLSDFHFNPVKEKLLPPFWRWGSRSSENTLPKVTKPRWRQGFPPTCPSFFLPIQDRSPIWVRPGPLLFRLREVWIPSWKYVFISCLWPDYPAAAKIVSVQAVHRAGETLLIWVTGDGAAPGEIFPLPKLLWVCVVHHF